MRTAEASSFGFTRADGEPITFAGLWDEWKDKATGEVVKSCTMLITEPNDFVAVFDQLTNLFDRLRRAVAVVAADECDFAAVNAALIVDLQIRLQ